MHEASTGRFTLAFLAAPQDRETARTARSPVTELPHKWDPTPSEGPNSGQVGFAVQDIYATCQRLSEQGVVLIRPPRDGEKAFVRSPDNISVGLQQAGAPSERRTPRRRCPTSGPGRPRPARGTQTPGETWT